MQRASSNDASSNKHTPLVDTAVLLLARVMTVDFGCLDAIGASLKALKSGTLHSGCLRPNRTGFQKPCFLGSLCSYTIYYILYATYYVPYTTCHMFVLSIILHIYIHVYTIRGLLGPCLWNCPSAYVFLMFAADTSESRKG